MTNTYTDGSYLTKTGNWHAEDSKWKAEQIASLLPKINCPINTLVEVGCGAGGILKQLSTHHLLKGTKISGYDISPQAIELCTSTANCGVNFFQGDPLNSEDTTHYDVLLAIDVIEHVPDYIGFLEKCRSKATYKIYHIPLDIHVSSVMRDTLTVARNSVGHLHYFTTRTALATLQDTGHEIVAYNYTNGATELFRKHMSIKRAAANMPRWILSRVSVALAAKMLGGYSLLVLAK